jgi:uncharacterized integral membrane protein
MSLVDASALVSATALNELARTQVCLAGGAMTVLAIVLAAQNTDNTTVEVFAANYRAPLIVVILAAAITGVILDEIRLHLTPPSPSARGTRRTAPAPPNAMTRTCATAPGTR